jgi:ABC-2 type transport system permease protein
MLRAQAGLELRLTLRRGESVLLTLIIPLALLLFFSTVDVLPAGSGRPVDFVVPGVLALAVLSTSFTGLAIATGFERSYGALKRLGASALPRSVLLAGKTLAVLAVEVLQIALLVVVGLALGWHPHGNPAVVVLLLVLGTAAFAALGLLMAGTLRAEATLAAANGVYLVLLMLGGIVFPLSQLPGAVSAVAALLPAAALATGLRAVLSDGAGLPLGDVVVLIVWAVVAGVLAARTFRWE